MRIVVFGSTGRTGLIVLERAVSLGHEVTAFARNANDLRNITGLAKTIVGNAADPLDTSPAIAGHDAVITLLSSTTRTDPYIVTNCHRAITEAMISHNVTRIVMTGAYGSIADRPPVIAPLVRRIFAEAFADSRAAETVLTATELDWTIVRPTRLTNGPDTPTRLSPDPITHRPYSISRASVATCLLDVAAGQDTIHYALNLTAR